MTASVFFGLPLPLFRIEAGGCIVLKIRGDYSIEGTCIESSFSELSLES
jgi:hypothetical protein